jgi:hypothetical protein
VANASNAGATCPREDTQSFRLFGVAAKPPVSGFQIFAPGDKYPWPRAGIAGTLADARAGQDRTSRGTVRPSLCRTYRFRMFWAEKRFSGRDSAAKAAGQKAAQNPTQSVHAESRTDSHDVSETAAPLAVANDTAVSVPPRGVE